MSSHMTRKEFVVQHQLDHEKLDVYRIELEFVAWATDLMVRVVSMLSRLVDRFSPPPQVLEAPTRYGIEDETSRQGDSGKE